MVNRSQDIAVAGPPEPAVRERPASLSIVIPALNEENGIDEILQRVLAQRSGLAEVGIRDLEVIVDRGTRENPSG